MAAEEVRLDAVGARETKADVRAWLAKSDAAGQPEDVVVGAISKMRQLVGLVAPPPWVPTGTGGQSSQQQGS